MNKYALIQKLVDRLTENDTFRTFYTLYLMAENQESRDALGQKFWKDVELMTEEEQQLLRTEFTRSFLRLPELLEQLQIRADATRVA